MNNEIISITEYVTLKTPNVVIISIAASFGINVDLEILEDFDNKKDVIKQLNETSLDNPDLTEMATFCNHKVHWNKTTLTIAFNNIMKLKESTFVPYTFEYGEPTPFNPLLIPLRILYRFCLLCGITPDIDDSGEDMYCKIMRYNAKKIIDCLDINSIVKFISANNVTHEFANNQDLEDIWKNLDSKIYLRNNYIPTTKEEAIVLTVQRFNLDISMSSCPIGEYTLLKTSKMEDYVPLDKKMKMWHDKNKDLFDIDIVFRNQFPEIFYKDIARTAEDFGLINDEDNEDPYSFLETVSLTPTWYRGWFPCLFDGNNIIRETNISLENKYNTNNILVLANSVDDLLSYNGNCHFDTIDTLTEHFRINGLVSPYSSSGNKLEYLSDVAINRLLHLCEDEDRVVRLITDIVKEQNSLKSKMEKLKIEYFTLNDSIQTEIKDIFFQLLHASMYMRGWDGSSEYPISNHNTPLIDQAEEKSCFAIFKLHEMIDNLGKYKDYVLSIPLVMYDEGKYVPSRSRSDGYTLGERLFLLSHGNTSRNQRSCMRESSNWFATTAHMVLKYIGAEPGFDIRGWSWSN